MFVQIRDVELNSKVIEGVYEKTGVKIKDEGSLELAIRILLDKAENSLSEFKFIKCPVCQCKTKVKLTPETTMKNFPLFCPKCKSETMINVEDGEVRVLK